MSDVTKGPASEPRASGLPETPRLVLTLALAGLLSGLAIVGIYRFTLPVIRANQARALQAAVFEVLPGAERMQRAVWRDGELLAAPGEATGGDAEAAVYAGYKADGTLVGYAIPAAGAGYQDTIRLIYGYDPATRRIVGMVVLESRETPGLGDRIFKDPDFVAQWRDLAVEPPLELVKGGATEPNQVDAITGATISSRSVVKIIRSANAEWLDRLPAADAAPALVEDAAPASGEQRGGPVPGGRLE